MFLEKEDAATPVEKPKIMDIKRKRIKKRKGNKNLLKICLSPDAPRRLKKKKAKKVALSSTQATGNARDVDMEPSLAEPLQNEKKENQALSPTELCADAKKENLVPSQELPCDKVDEEPSLLEPNDSVDKANGGALTPNMDTETGGNMNENEAPMINKSSVKSFIDYGVAEPLVNSDITAIDSYSIIMPAVNGLSHAPSDETDTTMELKTTVSNFASDMCLNHISADIESSTLLHGLLVESS